MDLVGLESTLSQMRSSQSIRRGLGINGITDKNGDMASNPLGNSIGGFGKLLTSEMDKINALDAQARQNVETYASGGDIPLHQVVLSVEKSDMALQMATQVRNRLIGAYQEISRMQV